MSTDADQYRDSLEMDDQNDGLEDVDAPIPTRMESSSRPFKPPRWMLNQRSAGQALLYRIRAIIRPRLSVRYVLCFALVLYLLYCFIRGSPLFASKLPQYSGPYNVGTIDMEVPVELRRNVSNIALKKNGKPAFELNTALFSLYYPAVNHSKPSLKPHMWIPKPISVTGAGYARAAHVDNFVMRSLFTFGLWLIAGRITIPAHVDARLISIADLGTDKSLPVMVFSHGTASSRTDYTHLCGELASQGVVVAAIEHRDGSGPASLLIGSNGKEKARVMYMLPSDLDVTGAIENDEFKRHQLAFREAEIEETIRVLRDIHMGSDEQLKHANQRGEGQHLNEWQGRLDLDHLVIAGHSYGATGALQALQGAPTSKTRPAAGGVIFDPGKSSGKLNDDIEVPVLVVHSSSWSKQHTIFFGRPHFETVYDLVKKALLKTGACWFITSLGTSHPSVTDAPLIEPLLLAWTTGASINAKQGVNEYAKVSLEFIDFLVNGRRNGVLAAPVSHPQYDNDTRTEEQKRSHTEVYKYWQIHIAPDE